MNADYNGGDDEDFAPNFEERVGHGCPPKKHQWPRHKSGNPAGRPPNSRSRKFKIARAADRKVSIRVNGRARSMIALEAIVYIITHKAIEGNAEAIKLRERLLGISEPEDTNPVPRAYLLRGRKLTE